MNQLLGGVEPQAQPAIPSLVDQGLRPLHTGAILAIEPEGPVDPRVSACAAAQQEDGHLQPCKNISIYLGETIEYSYLLTCLS